MIDRQIELVIGSLLHDIGKIVYRTGDKNNHSQSGYEYLKNEANIQNKNILDCVKYHHGANLKNAPLESNSIAYIVYFADNIAAAIDRRESTDSEDGFDKNVPLRSVFNLLNDNDEDKYYGKKILDASTGINYPSDTADVMDKEFYQSVIFNITDNLKGITISEEYINSLLNVLEANLTYVPSSTSLREQADISLFDHLKITAAVAHCMELYYQERGILDYRREVVANAKNTYGEKMFLLYSMDISGIQNFIYSVGSQGALKGLRARSFYLEILMEHIIDELLFCSSLSRANLIYSGGGHCYLLLPNTEQMKVLIQRQEEITNNWFMSMFGTDLYIAGDFSECSANDLKNEPCGSYSRLYTELSRKLSGKKGHRYNAKQILALNSRKYKNGERECRICRRMSLLDKDDRCSICAGLERMSGSILYDRFFTIVTERRNGSLPLPGAKYLIASDRETLVDLMKSECYVRSYSKNEFYTGQHMTTKLWVGSYSSRDTFEKLAEKAKGIQRIGILRADVDNLGQTFVQGFKRMDGDERYMTLSRTATLSRQLSLFFKYYINDILENGENCQLGGNVRRNISIVYSGGDDVFLVGAWNEVIEAFIDLKHSLERFTQNTITLSGGIGIYPSKYPINIMAKEVAVLEDISKAVDGKNAITIFDEDNTYKWEDFEKEVLGEKFAAIKSFFDISENRGNSFLYHILEILKESEKKRNVKFPKARYVYLLSRMEPEKDDARQKTAYREFSEKMYKWAASPQERKELITSIYLYLYLNRKEGEAHETE